MHYLATCIELGLTKRLLKRWRMHATCIGLENGTADVGLEDGRNIDRLNMIGWLRHLSRPDANFAQIDN